MSHKTVREAVVKKKSMNPFVFLAFLVVGYLGAKDIMGGFEVYQFGFDNANGSVWRARQSDGHVSYCAYLDWDAFPNKQPLCTEWSEN